MKNKRISIVVMILGITISMFGQAINYNGISGIMLAQNDDTPEIEVSTPRIKKKEKAEYRDNMSPLIASGLSLLLPGAGEFYGKDYIRSGIFLGIETVGLSMWYVYETEGDDKTSEFETFAQANFSENLYYRGLMGMSQNYVIHMQDSTWIDMSEVWNYDYFSNRDNWTWETKDSLAVLDIIQLSYGSYVDEDGFNGITGGIILDGDVEQFTHNLPETKTQQYYEMIGKYHQFSCGWNDFDGYEYNPDGSVRMETVIIENAAGDSVSAEIPVMLKNDANAFDYSEDGFNSANHVDTYVDLREEANIAYEVGQNFLMVTLLNHVASAFDAAYVIKSKYQIETKLRIENNDKADVLGLDNYKLTYSVNW